MSTRVFNHPNMLDFQCPVCGTAADKPVVLIPTGGTQRGGICEAKQVHVDCLLENAVYYEGGFISVRILK